MNNMKNTKEVKYIATNIFYGHEVSEYGKKNGYVDYRTLAKAFNAVMNNNIINCECGYFEPYNGSDFYTDEEGNEIYFDFYQYFIIDEFGANLLKEWTDECVLYNEELDIYLWCVNHYGTSWDYVLTDIKCNYTPNEE